MRLIAHRGFAQGKDENTLAALARAAADARIQGVELDIRWSRERTEVVLRHDPFPAGGGEPAPLALDEALRFAAAQDWEVLLECKEFDDALYARLRESVAAHGLAPRVVLFAFDDIAARFPWSAPRPFRLGVIEKYPWGIARTIRRLAPDVVLMGWTEPWERAAVQAWWSMFSLGRVARRFPETEFIMGVAQNEADIAWLRARGAVSGATVDFWQA
jgi:hypothetical protein